MERDEFDEAVATHQRRVFTFARYFLSDQQEAEDVTQEVLIRLWRNIDEIAPEKRRAWLNKVTRNACYDRLRRRKSQRPPAAELDRIPTGELMTTDPDPETRASASQIGGRLAAAIRRLKDPQRSVVIMREIQGLSCAEIGAALEMSAGTVRVTLHRARRKLRDELREVYGNA
jgi:RNA polymerase sigma-70 factor (ECF subfamily)